MTALEIIVWAKERHHYYCCIGEKFVSGFGLGFRLPEFELFARRSLTAGRASYFSRVCQYNLIYLLAVEQNYEQTIAHEVAHIVVRSLKLGAKVHGGLFKFVLRDIFHVKAKKDHNYSWKEEHAIQAIAILKLDKVIREIEEMALLEVSRMMRIEPK